MGPVIPKAASWLIALLSKLATAAPAAGTAAKAAPAAAAGGGSAWGALLKMLGWGAAMSAPTVIGGAMDRRGQEKMLGAQEGAMEKEAETASTMMRTQRAGGQLTMAAAKAKQTESRRAAFEARQQAGLDAMLAQGAQIQQAGAMAELMGSADAAMGPAAPIPAEGGAATGDPQAQSPQAPSRYAELLAGLSDEQLGDPTLAMMRDGQAGPEWLKYLES